MQATIDIDAQLLQEAEQLARRNGQPFSLFVEQALRDSLRVSELKGHPPELHGEPLSDEEITESARVTFRTLDEEEKRAEAR